MTAGEISRMAGCSLQPFDRSRASAVSQLVNAAAMKTVGFRRAAVDGAGNLWAFRFVPPSADRVVAVDASGSIVGYAYFRSGDNHIVAETGGAVHPDCEGRGIGTLLLEWAEQKARTRAVHAPAGIRTVLQTVIFDADQAAAGLLEKHGYFPVRRWQHFVLEMDRPPGVPSLAPGFMLREMDLERDWDLAGPAMDEAFATHWGAVPPDLCEATQAEEAGQEDPGEEVLAPDSSYSNTPGYCFLILDRDSVAGGVLCNARLVEREDTGRIGSLFVRPRYRRQGLGRALLLAALGAFRENAYRRVTLETDAESFTRSTSLYESVGMRPYRQEVVYEKEIRPGREVRLLANRAGS